jgi:hypothetical protein
MEPEGILVVVVPDCRANISDFYTIDHTSHYEADVLARVFNRSGFAGQLTTDIPSELCALGHPCIAGGYAESLRPDCWDGEVGELVEFERNVKAIPDGSYHVFGTAMIGMLVAEVLKDRCVGFVDEARFRIGKTILGRQVRSPQELAGQCVVLGVARPVAEQLTPRLRVLGCTVINPWGDSLWASQNWYRHAI